MAVKQLNIRIDEDEFTFVKTFASANKLSLQSFILSAIRSKIDELSQKNIETTDFINADLTPQEQAEFAEVEGFFNERPHLAKAKLPEDFLAQVKAGCGAEKMAEMLGYTKDDWNAMK